MKAQTLRTITTRSRIDLVARSKESIFKNMEFTAKRGESSLSINIDDPILIDDIKFFLSREDFSIFKTELIELGFKVEDDKDNFYSIAKISWEQ